MYLPVKILLWTLPLLNRFRAAAKPVGWDQQLDTNHHYDGFDSSLHGFDWQEHQSVQAWSPNPFDQAETWPVVQSVQQHDARAQQGQRAEYSALDASHELPPRQISWLSRKEQSTDSENSVARHGGYADGDEPRQKHAEMDHLEASPVVASASSGTEERAIRPSTEKTWSFKRLQRLEHLINSRKLKPAPRQLQFIFAAPGGSTESQVRVIEQAKRAAMREWEDSMKTVLGNPFLEFRSAELMDPSKPLLIVAQNAWDVRDRHPLSSSGAFANLPTYSREGRHTHFMYRLTNVVSVQLQKLGWKSTRNRILVYLNSRFNMDYLNNEYFLGKLRFLPIDTHKLTRGLLDKVFSERKRVMLLPPRSEHGLSLVLARHNDDASWLHELQQVTGPLQDARQLVSLWSPILRDKYRTTLVLYGVAQLDARYEHVVLQHLNDIVPSWTGGAWDILYYLEKHEPHAFLTA
ncbi:effector family protein Eff1-5 [Mycosarcoma maydis]|uniref:Effector family protein Eff1-5 n=1 Tax=Mycosarcoma maydis TaxID=5270 RepID=Q4PCM8_MYCMD|nr:effector family protein Eff1-5 [Ustilago maydis 521]KIS69600.1 effector family protein Eff1-5 [Ustilago maydis 521]CBV36770.1 TPA: effector family protein Eff1-5 [Ustilago maydis 521]|eukprot:XP_011388492.1 effector family protein Eff1-5 [Ustilago maydis 521]